MEPKNARKFRLMFLCTGNSARSILAEYLAKKYAGEIFKTVSAGSNPKPSPHAMALKLLRETFHIPAEDARSKSWEEFQGETFDFVITLCDSAREVCPVWPGQPIIAHWGSPDPAEPKGSEAEQQKMFWDVAQQIRRRIALFASLPFERLDALKVAAETREIGEKEKF